MEQHIQCWNSRTFTGQSEKHSSSLCFITGILQKGKVPPSITTPRSGVCSMAQAPSRQGAAVPPRLGSGQQWIQ